MAIPIQPGEQRRFSRHVRPEDCAAFDSGSVHPVYATFALARDAEWCCRLFVLDVKSTEEEGIGTMISVEHISPATEGSTVDFTAVAESVAGNEIICGFEAHCNGRLVAKGKTGQKILKKEKLERLFQSLDSNMKS
ncbi:thioesterase family protein [Chitinophaga caseinilytica]|uniref:Fluoroacetyl-CoA-specific thioesterase-like domain-containing protein n=1 Tax=Chitinophaga caseinilytica TaxID=2267521 RepID=A0ABZ2Z8U5_9BACT